jgi:hypothetical protein
MHAGIYGNWWKWNSWPLTRAGYSQPHIGPEPALGICAKVARGVTDWMNRKHEEQWQFICGQRLRHFGHIKIRAPGLTLYGTVVWRHFCQQDTALYLRCGAAGWINIGTDQRIKYGQSAWVTIWPPSFYSILF